jgi:hypothetical protein
MTYSGLFIDYDRILSPAGSKLGNMSTNLQKMSSTCDNLAMGTNNTQATGPLLPFPPLPLPGAATIRALILVLPTPTVIRYNTQSQTNPDSVLNELNNGSQFNESLGHCYVSWDKNSNICGIFDVCLHNKFISKGGIGTIFMNIIMDSILINFPNNTIIWAGVDIRNQNFTKVISLYAKVGFEKPFVAFKDPFGNDYSKSLVHGFVSLQRENDYVDPTDIDRKGTIDETLYMLQQYAKVTKRGDINLSSINEVKKGIDSDTKFKKAGTFCTIQAKFDIPFANWLSKLPMAASTLNQNGTVTQKEVGGAFWLDTPVIGSDGLYMWNIYWYKEKGINATREESVDMVIGRYNFHTHPREAYINHKVFIGFPSGQDYYAFLTATIKDSTVFHCVITLEGVYVISLLPFWANNMSELSQLITNGGDELYQHVKYQFEIPKVIPPGQKAIQAARNYPSIIRKMELFTGKPPVYNSEFLSWGDIKSGKAINVAYPVIYSQCFATERSMEAVRKLHQNLK